MELLTRRERGRAKRRFLDVAKDVVTEKDAKDKRNMETGGQLW